MSLLSALQHSLLLEPFEQFLLLASLFGKDCIVHPSISESLEVLFAAEEVSEVLRILANVTRLSQVGILTGFSTTGEDLLSGANSQHGETDHARTLRLVLDNAAAAVLRSRLCEYRGFSLLRRYSRRLINQDLASRWIVLKFANAVFLNKAFVQVLRIETTELSDVIDALV